MYVADVNPVCSNVADFAFSQLCLSFFYLFVLQEGSEGCSHLCGLVLFSHGVLLCCPLLEMVQTFSHVCNFRNSSSSESQNL